MMVNFGPHFTIPAHIQLKKALGGTNWGQQSETVSITYNSLVCSIFCFAYLSVLQTPSLHSSKISYKQCKTLTFASLLAT